MRRAAEPKQMEKLMRRVVLAGLALCALAVLPARAQVSPSLYDYVQSDLDWYTIETDHFEVHFHLDDEGRGSSRTAQVVARIAEDVFEPITALYDHRPDTKVDIILKDYLDYSNGAAYFFDNMIEIWAPALDTPLRGDHNWLRNVITHEFTHIVQVQAAMKGGRRMPFLYLQYLDYEQARRPDVLYGYPNVVVTYPVPVLNNPAWLAEGTAQYQRAGIHYDQWDTHRDMLLRTRVLAGEALTLSEMGGFYSHTSLLREGVYNHGFAFTRYLAATYGEAALHDVSRALGKWRNWNVERAFEDALGVPGGQVYDDWMAALGTAYEERSAAVRASLVEGELLEADGFFNFYPRFSPDGRRLAYISNKGEDYSGTALYVTDLETGEATAMALPGLLYEDGPVHTCAFGHRVTGGVSGGIAWRPDGRALVYARKRDNRYGHRYADLYEVDLETEETKRLTRDQRATMPAYAPDGGALAFVGNADGTTNLYRLDLATDSVTALTAYRDGRQVSDPVWHPGGEWIYFARMDERGRDLWRVRADGTAEEPVLATAADERSPAFDADGAMLYYASDASGIFNLYRRPVGVATGAEAERLTNVLGGAFMPAVSPDGGLAFAQYQWDGYKIARFDAPPMLSEGARTATYTPPAITQKQDPPALASADFTHLNGFDDTDLRPLATDAVTQVHTEGSFPLHDVPARDDAEAVEAEVEPYEADFTSFSFFPVVRLDAYVERERRGAETGLAARTRGETALRNTKLGVYMTSREILDGLTMLGGVMVGPASRDADSFGDAVSPANLIKLERDAFLSFEYKRGFGLIPQRWSPQFAVELFNVRRNVEDGLVVEEFPCTACFPDTTVADIAYNLWEFNLAARSKVRPGLLLEAGYRYSPYRVTTERFFSKELLQSIPESSSRYFIGRAFFARAYLEAYKPHRHGDVVPEGAEVQLSYEYEPGRLLDRFDVEDGTLVPVYAEYDNHRLQLDARFGMRLPGGLLGAAHGVGLRLRGSTILSDAVDPFFNDYVGGLTGARGYPFYALGGNETLWFQAAYHVPLVPRIGRQVLFTYVDKIYGRLYADAAMAWSGAWPGLDKVRKDVGAEVRVKLGSFYLLPTALFASATYGLDAFDFQLDEDFVTPDGQGTVRYGEEWQWHFGVLFGFDL